MGIPAPIGHNSLSFDQAIERLETSGFMLARLETLMIAVRDKRLDRACLLVLATLIETMNNATLTTWIGKDTIAQRLGITPKSVSNYIYQLKALGYILSERRETEHADGLSLLHYTLTKLSPVEIEAAITNAVKSLKGESNNVIVARHDGLLPVPTGDSTLSSPPVPTGNQDKTACPDGQTTQDLPALTGKTAADPPKTARPDGHSNSSKNNNITTTVESRGGGVGEGKNSNRATRLPETWVLPKAWGDWALEHFQISPSEIRGEAAASRDYWTSLGNNRQATKTNWKSTWHNWLRNSKKNWKIRKQPDDIAPDLGTDHGPSKLSMKGMSEEQRSRVEAAIGKVKPNA